MPRSELAKVYLDWKNNFLTLGAFAEHYGLYKSEALALIALGKKCFEVPHPDS